MIMITNRNHHFSFFFFCFFFFFFAFIVIRALKIVISCTSTCKEEPDISNNMSIYALFKTYIHKIIDILLTNALCAITHLRFSRN